MIVHDSGSIDKTIDIVNYYSSNVNNIILLDDGIKCSAAKENFSHLLDSIDRNFDYIMFGDQDDMKNSQVRAERQV